MFLQKIHHELTKALQRLQWPLLPGEISRPKQKEHGDLATNVAFLLAKELKKAPRAVAQELVEALQPLPDWLQSAEVAGAGFINFRIAPSAFFAALEQVAKEKEKFGTSKIGKGKKIILEFVSANPTGPLNVVSARAAAVGDTIGNLLTTVGYKVTREYYVNDVGGQIDLFGQSIAARLLQLKGETAEIPEGGYHGEYLKEFAQELAKKGKKCSPEQLQELGVITMVAEQKRVLEQFGVWFDRWQHQSELMKKKKIPAILKKLEKQKVLFEQEGALFFRSTQYGDDKDRVVKKQDGEYSYFASDIAYHDDKFARGFDRAIDLFGPDHHGYIARTKAAVAACGWDPNNLEVLLIQQVRFLEGETLIKMSKRAGKLITMEDLLAEVGRDAVRFFFLMRSSNTPLDFDLELAKKETPENPVFYVQYAHARIASIFRKAEELGITWKGGSCRSWGPSPRFGGDRPTPVTHLFSQFHKQFSFELLNLPEEKSLAQKILEFPEVVARSAADLEPHHLIFYSLELAQEFQAYYSQAKQDPRYRVLDLANLPKTAAKLYLLKNLQIVLQNALKLLGISAPERMEHAPGTLP